MWNVIRWILWKDFRVEVRNSETVASLFFFALNLILIFSFSFSTDREITEAIMPGLLWVAFGFTSVLGLGKSFFAETRNDCLSYLQMAPVSKGGIYFGKLLGNFIFLLIVELILIPLFILFFNLDIVGRLLFFVVIVLIPATFGLSAVGTLFSILTVKTRVREVLFPLLLFPLSVPVFIGAVESTQGVFAGYPLTLYLPWIELLIVFDLVLTLASFWLFQGVLEYS